MKRYKGFGGEEELPGSVKAADRFVRAAFYVGRLPEPKNQRQGVAGVLSVMRNVAQPFGTSKADEPNTSQTIWRTVADLTNGVYYFESTTSPNIVWVKLNKLDFTEGAKVQKLLGMGFELLSLARTRRATMPYRIVRPLALVWLGDEVEGERFGGGAEPAVDLTHGPAPNDPGKQAISIVLKPDHTRRTEKGSWRPFFH